ncbi:DNA repair protein rad18 [Cladophialophora bantiana CBS 173.52]|uniref:Postreplication repair E3 ubiquitin-protein ligase RAD18 n=1 Tax=Cladophialophora bantiana (strain ATCC 10958 / CBS 173.52 / CDC B-1940 / NIH 8579) TaxID=1442370 RepID=A0A0D2H3G6_CLAB1|nr:DNA repair protein rad18 [Cladophialophora bantiana CBS 173.52]KIW87858.1 DNA repair protein rad18 [Cladophialophora bantiana CBS 173.52]
MADRDEFTDSTDWLQTPLAALAPLDSSLRCQVCKDYFTTPMMTSCSHTFCSLCIRRCLSQEGRCPACRDADQEIKLRRNWAVEELVAHFTASRKGLLAFATASLAKGREREDDGETQRPRKRRKLAPESTSNGIERRSTRSQSRKIASDIDSQQSMASTQEVIDDSEEEGSVYEDPEEHKSPHFVNDNGNLEPQDGLVQCPCCHRRMKEALINSHLDKCIQGDSHTPGDEVGSYSPAPPSNARHVAPPGTIAYAQGKPAKQHDRLPFINYSLLSDNALRKKLRDLGIPYLGSKDLMRRRHTEWVNLWNANCDSTKPVTKRELLRELKIWEDTLGRQPEKPSNTGFMAKDFDRERHVKSQKSHFDDLIRQARARKPKFPEEKSSSAAENPTSDAAPWDPMESASPRQISGAEPAGSECSADAGERSSPGSVVEIQGRQHLESKEDTTNGHSEETARAIPSPQQLEDTSESQLAVQVDLTLPPERPHGRFFV